MIFLINRYLTCLLKKFGQKKSLIISVGNIIILWKYLEE
jgi:hypothetical protein